MSKDIQKEHTDQLMDGMVIAYLESYGHTFEIIIEADFVDGIKSGEVEDILEHMPEETIFKDARKGDRASEDAIKQVFDTDDIAEIVKYIIDKGQVQLTTEQRRKMQENKRKKVVDIIARNAINPQTGAPHPPQRIENALAEAKFNIDPFKSSNDLVKDALTALQPLIPIRFEKLKVAVRLSGDDYGKVYPDLTSFGKIIKEEWQSTGNWIGVVEIPAGIQLEFFDRLNEKTKGDVECKILKPTI